MVDAIRSSGAEPIFVRQPMTTKHSSDHPHGRPDPLLTYEAEVEWIRDNLKERGWVSSIEALMLVHRALLKVFDRVAVRRQVVVIDDVAIVDRDLSFFASYVHLTGRKCCLARALADAIVPLAERKRRRMISIEQAGVQVSSVAARGRRANP